MIGILGGTFDPIHFGHLRTALEVQQALGLTEVRIVPLRNPPHRDPPIATTEQRLEMITAAIADELTFRLDTQEIEREGESYTVRTLRSLREQLGDEISICLIVGSDAFRGFPDWHHPEEILHLSHIVVMLRPGEPLPDLYPERFTDNLELLSADPAGHVWAQSVTQLQISSTHIRELLSQGLSPRYLLPASVLEIIEQQGLYRQ
jgi:nicotinate-nucleotide adenylyltransferase